MAQPQSNEHHHPEIEQLIASQDARMAVMERLLVEQAGLNRDIVRLVGSIDDRLERIEEHLRRITPNGQQQP